MFFIAPAMYILAIYVLAAVLPAVFLMRYIYRQDQIEPEPPGLLIGLIFSGVAAALCSIVLEMLASLNCVNLEKERLIEITADGKIEGDEIDDFIRIQEELEKISVTVEALQLWAEKMLVNGIIDPEAYRARKQK